MTARQLADELEVSVRTVYRDMESLGAAGIPLYGEPGTDGGYALLEGYRTKLTGLTRDEAEVLFLSGLPGPAADLGLGGALATARLKLMAALPAELRAGVDRVQARFHLDTSNWYADREVSAHLADVVGAVWEQVRVRMTYRRWADPPEVTRAVEPYGVVLKSGRWYLVGRNGESVRTYRVSRIVGLELLDEEFERPAEFHLGRYWTDYLDEFDARRYQGEATVRMSAAVLERLPHLLEPTLVRAARDNARPDGDDWVRTVIPMESLDHTAGLVLRLGAEAEVLDPPSLRQHLAETVAGLAERYRPGPDRI